MPNDMTPRIGLVSAALIVAAAVTAPTSAQRIKDTPQAIAAVQAPESGIQVCHSISARAALDCARKRCENKAGRGACFAITVCEPMGWSGLMGVQLSEVHFTKTVCGAPSQEALLTSLKAFCSGHVGMKQCSVTHIWSPDGKLQKAEGAWTADDFKKQ
jgi:hypothetical protein